MHKVSRKTKFEKGDLIFLQGDDGDCAYIIESGIVEILLDSGDSQVVIAKLKKGDILGEAALIDRLPRSGSARALVATIVTEIPYDYFSQKIDQTDPAVKMFLRIVMARYRDLNARLGSVSASLPSDSDQAHANTHATATQELKDVTSLYKDLQNRINSAVIKPSIHDSKSAFSDHTLEMTRVMVTEEKMLKRAIENEEFVLYFQPVIDLSKNKIMGCEALVRWNHPSGVLYPPSQFIALAEESNLIQDLGILIAEKACSFQNYVKETFNYNFYVAMNLSAKQFNDKFLVTKLLDIIEKSGANRNKIEFEITESILINNPELAANALHEIKALGIGLAIDDFGTGYSSFSYLHQLPFDKLKIDRSFVSSMSRDRKSERIVKSMINMAHDLEMKVVAEGIETKREVITLRDYKATYGQGYYFSKPLSEENMIKLLLPNEL